MLERCADQARPFQLPALATAPALGSAGMSNSTATLDEAALERARQEGFTQGLAAAGEQASGLPAPEWDQLEAEVLSINELIENFDQRLTMFVLALSLQLSSLVLRSAARVKADQVIPSIRAALRNLPGMAEDTRLHVSARDAALLRRLAASDARLALPWEIVDEDALTPGECRFRSVRLGGESDAQAPWRQAIQALGESADWVDAQGVGKQNGAV
jgi:flagellar assembly protein FliH